MPAPYAAQSYLQTQVKSASPLELVVMLYDAALRAAANAHEAMVRQDIPARRAALSRLMAVVAELQSTLDMAKGGALAEELDSIYSYVMGRLLEAVSRQDPQPIAEVQRILSTLRGAWQQIATQPAPARQPGARP